MPEVRRHGSARGAAGSARRERRELLQGPVELALPLELRGEHVAQLDEHLDVERGVAQPGLGQRPGRPVDGRVLLGQAEPEELLDDGGEPDPLAARRAGPPSSVSKSAPRTHADLREAGQVLAGGVQHPLGAGERRADRGQVRQGGRVEQDGAGALAAQLDQEGALAVPVPEARSASTATGPVPAASAAAARASPAGVTTTGGTPSRGVSSGCSSRGGASGAAGSIASADMRTP